MSNEQLSHPSGENHEFDTSRAELIYVSAAIGVYTAEHDVERILSICREQHLNSKIPLAPYVLANRYLGLHEEKLWRRAHREAEAYLRNGKCSRLYLCGDAWNERMGWEVQWALEGGVEIEVEKPELQARLDDFLGDKTEGKITIADPTGLTFWYAAHPISGYVDGNLNSVLRTVWSKELQSDILIAPYAAALFYLNDDNPPERRMGMDANQYWFARREVHGLYLCGERLSFGMKEEVRLALLHGQQFWCETDNMRIELDNYVEELDRL